MDGKNRSKKEVLIFPYISFSRTLVRLISDVQAVMSSLPCSHFHLVTKSHFNLIKISNNERL